MTREEYVVEAMQRGGDLGPALPGWMRYPIPLPGRETMASMILPCDLTMREAERLCAVLRTLPLPALEDRP